MRVSSHDHVYNFDWETTTAAFWVKYPNPEQKHVLRVDTISFDYDEETRIVRQRRILHVDVEVPNWVKRVVPYEFKGTVIEDSVLDLKNRRLELTSRNVAFANVFSCVETCIYTPLESDPSKTQYHQKSCYNVSLVPGMNGRLEAACADHAKKAIGQGVGVLDHLATVLRDIDWRSQNDYVAAASDRHGDQFDGANVSSAPNTTMDFTELNGRASIAREARQLFSETPALFRSLFAQSLESMLAYHANNDFSATGEVTSSTLTSVPLSDAASYGNQPRNDSPIILSKGGAPANEVYAPGGVVSLFPWFKRPLLLIPSLEDSLAVALSQASSTSAVFTSSVASDYKSESAYSASSSTIPKYKKRKAALKKFRRALGSSSAILLPPISASSYFACTSNMSSSSPLASSASSQLTITADEGPTPVLPPEIFNQLLYAQAIPARKAAESTKLAVQNAFAASFRATTRAAKGCGIAVRHPMRTVRAFAKNIITPRPFALWPTRSKNPGSGSQRQLSAGSQ